MCCLSAIIRFLTIVALIGKCKHRSPQQEIAVSLGSDRTDRHMNQRLSIYCVTWNVKGETPKTDVSPMLFADWTGLVGEGVSADSVANLLPDVYVIGLQEVPFSPVNLIFRDPWTEWFDRAFGAVHYVRLKVVKLVGVLLAVYVRRQLLPMFRSVRTEYTRTGFGGLWGNKGGVSVRTTYRGVSLCFVNSHLAPHYEQLEQRIADYNTIVDSQHFDAPQTPNILSHDFVIWIGDLNFRIDDFTGDEIHDRIVKYNKSKNNSRELLELLDKDQLIRVRREGRAFSEFNEKVPTFAPTYKFLVNTDNYDYKARKPAWTDRIVYRFTANAYNGVILGLEQLSYSSHPQYKQSDHKPVTALFRVDIRAESRLAVDSLSTKSRLTLSPLDEIMTDADVISVTFLPLNNCTVNSESSVWYTVSPGDDRTVGQLSNWDWIGLYRGDFISVDDHISFLWANSQPTQWFAPSADDSDHTSSSDSSQSSSSQSRNRDRKPWFRLSFSDLSLLIADTYRLVYVTQDGNVLGISDPFQVNN